MTGNSGPRAASRDATPPGAPRRVRPTENAAGWPQREREFETWDEDLEVERRDFAAALELARRSA